MGVYELISSIEPGTFELFVSKGLFSCTIKRDKSMYEFYTNELKTVSRMQALLNTSEKFKVSEKTVSNVIQKMR